MLIEEIVPSPWEQGGLLSMHPEEPTETLCQKNLSPKEQQIATSKLEYWHQTNRSFRVSCKTTRKTQKFLGGAL